VKYGSRVNRAKAPLSFFGCPTKLPIVNLMINEVA